jgi:hypothetical protein
MYNGGVTYRGDEKKASAIVPDAIRLAGLVRTLKLQGGLDRLEKTYDIEGGTIRVVDNDYVRHIYIDVSTPEGEEPEETTTPEEPTYEELFAIYPAYQRDWKVDGKYAVVIGMVKTPQELTLTAYSYAEIAPTLGYHETPPSVSRFRTGAVRYEDSYGEQFTMYLEYPKGGSNLSWGDITNADRVYHKGYTAAITPSREGIYGFGLFKSPAGAKRVWLTAKSNKPPTDHASPLAAGFQDDAVTIYAEDVVYTGDRWVTSGPTVTVGTFTQGRTEYPGVTEGGGYPYTSLYNESEAFYTPEPTFSPELAYHPQAGTLWFAFNPEGTAAVRCRYFPSKLGASLGTSHQTFKEVLTFTVDGFNDMSFDRTITEVASGGSLTYTKGTPVTGGGGNTETRSPTQESTPPNHSQDTSLDVTSIDYEADSTSNTIDTWSVDTSPLVLAYDYDMEGRIVTLKARFTGAGRLEENVDSNYTWSENYDYAGFEQPEIGNSPTFFSSSISGSGGSTTTNIYSTSVPFTTTLIWVDGDAVEHEIPYYNYSVSSSYTKSITESTGMAFSWEYRFGVGNEDAVRGQDSGSTTSSNLASNSLQNVYTNGSTGSSGGVVAMDLKRGIFVMSYLERTATGTSNGITADTVVWNNQTDRPNEMFPFSGPVLEYEKGSSGSMERKDFVYKCAAGNVAATQLSPIQGGAGRPLYTNSWTAPVSGGMHGEYDVVGIGGVYNTDCTYYAGTGGGGSYRSNYYNPFPPAVTYPLRPGSWCWGLVKGNDGMLAVSLDNNRFLFTVLGNDLTSQDPDTYLRWSTAVSANMQFYNFCQQGIYYSHDGDVYDLNPLLDIVGALDTIDWHSEGDELGPSSFAETVEGEDSYGAWGFVEFMGRREIEA